MSHPVCIVLPDKCPRCKPVASHCRPVTAAVVPTEARSPEEPAPQSQDPAARAQEAIKAILQERPKQLAARSLAPQPAPQPPAQPEDSQLRESAIARLAKMLMAQPSSRELSAEEKAEIPVRSLLLLCSTHPVFKSFSSNTKHSTGPKLTGIKELLSSNCKISFTSPR